MAERAREFDIVLWGSTGFTGQLVAERIVQYYQGQIKWAIAGRHALKLSLLRKKLAGSAGSQDIPIIVADLKSKKSIDAMISSTKVLVSTAGPYSTTGTPIVDACIRLQTHYCDITGEVTWVHKLINLYHDRAQHDGVKIVPMCGYESIPFDLGTLMVVDSMREMFNKPAASVTTFIGASTKTMVSGGTIASLITALKAPDEDRRKGEDPYALNPPKSRRWPDEKYKFEVGYDGDLKAYTSPWVMALSNGPVVRRSDAFLQYGDCFSYNERMYHKTESAARAAKRSIINSIAALENPLTRTFLRCILPKPGEGPTVKQMMAAPWHHILVGKTQEDTGIPSQLVVGHVAGQQDRSYYLTATMVLEAAMCLLCPSEEVLQDGKPKGGVLTPAVAFGHTLTKRLCKRGMTFYISKPTDQ
eukprot:jgi/Botrbrau1/8616/Bobra.0196s0014.2